MGSEQPRGAGGASSSNPLADRPESKGERVYNPMEARLQVQSVEESPLPSSASKGACLLRSQPSMRKLIGHEW